MYAGAIKDVQNCRCGAVEENWYFNGLMTVTEADGSRLQEKFRNLQCWALHREKSAG